MQTSERKKVFWEYLIIACIVSACNVLFCFHRIYSLGLIGIEIGWLMVQFMRGKVADYVAYFAIFMCNCLEYTTFTGEDTFYSLKNTRIYGINLGIILLLPVFIWAVFHLRKISKVKLNKASCFSLGLIAINIVAAVVGLMLILANDNNITVLGNVFFLYLEKAYSMIFLPMAFILAFAILVRERDYSIYKIGLALQATLWANVFQMLTSLVSGIRGSYGALVTMQISILNFLVPFLILLYFYRKEVIYPRMTVVIGAIGSTLAVLFNSNGKLILMAAICSLLFWYLGMREGSFFMKLFTLLALIFLIPAVSFILTYISQNPLFAAKFNDVKLLLNVFDADWLQNLSASPRVRVEEFRDMFLEFAEKPWLILTGKGYLGSIQDHTGYFYTHLASNDGFCSDAEWAHGIFYALHEIVSYILMYGVMGILFMAVFLKDAVSLFFRERNIWILIGAYWFFMFCGYSFTVSTFGCLALLYGLYTSEMKHEVIE
ncbi:MAG: hypothetical protein HFH41_02645 [Lachnospiraceae bacterium]|nr:hypothetical protein [Lachnospiraceae bacterium]